MVTLSIVLIVLGIVYAAINLMMFGMALCFMSTADALIYLFFGTIVMLKEFFIDPWIR